MWALLLSLRGSKREVDSQVSAFSFVRYVIEIFIVDLDLDFDYDYQQYETIL